MFCATRFEEQHHAERGDHRVEVRSVPQRAEHQPLEGHAGQRQRRHRHGHRRPVVEPGARHQRVGQVRAEHEQLAVREVGHLHRAVDQGQPKRDEAVDAAGDQTVEDLLREEFHAAHEVVAHEPLGGAARLRRAVALDHARSTSPARRRRRRRGAAACSGRAPASRRQRRGKPHLVEPVVDAHARAVDGADRVAQQPAGQRQA